MNYELAKKLQQTLSQCSPEMEPMDMRNDTWLPRDMNNFSITLSELIEACGDSFLMLVHPNKGIRDDWSAFGVPNNGFGSTPEEAVAELYLALNSK